MTGWSKLAIVAALGATPVWADDAKLCSLIPPELTGGGALAFSSDPADALHQNPVGKACPAQFCGRNLKTNVRPGQPTQDYISVRIVGMTSPQAAQYEVTLGGRYAVNTRDYGDGAYVQQVANGFRTRFSVGIYEVEIPSRGKYAAAAPALARRIADELKAFPQTCTPGATTPETFNNAPAVYPRPADPHALAGPGAAPIQAAPPPTAVTRPYPQPETYSSTPRIFTRPATRAEQIAGRWSYVSGGARYSVQISQSGNSVTFTDQANRAAGGRIENGKIIADAWQMQGTISGNQIRWNNGAVWTRDDGAFASAAAPPATLPTKSVNSLTGSWYINADPRLPARIVQDVAALTLTDSNGQVSKGHFEGRQIVADLWKVRGNIEPGEMRIDWSNGSYWTRMPSDVIVPRMTPAPASTTAGRSSAGAPPKLGKTSVCFTGNHAGAAWLNPQGYLEFASQNPTATLQNQLTGRIRTLYGCRYITPDQLSSLFADISVLIAQKVRDARCFGGDSGALGTDWNSHKAWAAQRTDPRIALDNLTRKTSAALGCMNRSDQAVFFAEAAVAVAGAMDSR